MTRIAVMGSGSWGTAFALVLVLSPGLPAGAQVPAPLPKEEPAPPLPIEYDDAARRAYAQGLGEARDLASAKRHDEALARLDLLIAARPREPQARFLKAVVLATMIAIEYRPLPVVPGRPRPSGGALASADWPA